MPSQGLTGDTVCVLRNLANVPAFCVDGLPDWLRDYTGELSIRYTVPQSDLTLACLATAGTAVGSRAKMDLGWGARHVGSNLLVVMRSEASGNLVTAVEHVVMPIVSRQNEILRRRGEFDALKGKKDIGIPRERLGNPGISDGAHRRCATEFGDILRIAKPALLIGRLDRETLVRTLSQSVDGALFLCNESAGQQNGYLPETTQPMDMELVQRCLDRSPIIESIGRTHVSIGEPALGGILIATPLNFASWLGQCSDSPALGASLLLLRSPAKAAMINNAILEAFYLQEEWCLRIENLMDTSSSDSILLRPSRHAQVTLFEYYNELLHLRRKLPQSAQDLIGASFHLATRLAVGLNLLTRRSLEIENETAVTAVKLARHYGARQICSWLDAHVDVINSHDSQGHSKVVRLQAA